MTIGRLVGAAMVLGAGLMTLLGQVVGQDVGVPNVTETGGLLGGYGLALFMFSIYRAEKKASEDRALALTERAIKSTEEVIAMMAEVRGAFTSMGQFDRLEAAILKMGGGDEPGRR